MSTQKIIFPTSTLNIVDRLTLQTIVLQDPFLAGVLHICFCEPVARYTVHAAMEFEKAYNEFSKLVYNLALKYVQNSEDAEEITQDVFVSVYRSIHTYRKEAELSTWIYRITIHKSLDRLRAKKRNKRFAFFSSLFGDSDHATENRHAHFNHPGVLLEQKEALARLFEHINKLPENQKTVLILSKLEQKSQKEVADILKISPKAVESLLQRAKTNLLKKIDPSEGKNPK